MKTKYDRRVIRVSEDVYEAIQYFLEQYKIQYGFKVSMTEFVGVAIKDKIKSLIPRRQLEEKQ